MSVPLPIPHPIPGPALPTHLVTDEAQRVVQSQPPGCIRAP